MRLSSVHVKNYRALRDVRVPLSRFVCITGENNAGKSSMLQGLSLFLSGNSIRTTDFFDPSQEVTLTVTFEDVSDADLSLLALEHRDRIAEIVRDGAFTLVRRYGLDGKSQLGYIGLTPKDPRFAPDRVDALLKGKKAKDLRDAVATEFSELATTLTSSITQATARKMIDELSSQLPDDQKELRFRPLPTGVDKSILPMLPEHIYIPAVKNLADDTKTAESSTFGKILGILMQSIESKLADQRDIFRSLSEKLTRTTGPDGQPQDVRLQEIRDSESLIQGFVRESFSDVGIKLEIPPPELRTILSTARILADDGMEGPLETKGDGLRRAVVFSVLRAYVEIARRQNGQPSGTAPIRGYLLLFEEPELFLHPGAQKMLFDALGVFARQHHVVVTTHSPLFLGPDTTATFVRFSRTRSEGIPKPSTRPVVIDLSEMEPRDEFQLICYENNNAAFFAKKVVLVEGDSDAIVLPHMASLVNREWDCAHHGVAVVRVGGKGSIGRYRKFFNRFDVPVYVVADLDILVHGFEALDPTPEVKTLRSKLLACADAEVAKQADAATLGSAELRDAHASRDLKSLWSGAKCAYAAFVSDASKFQAMNDAVESFFAFERQDSRKDAIRLAEGDGLLDAKRRLLFALREDSVFVWEKGAIDDYYPASVTGRDKPSRAHAFKTIVTDHDALLELCPEQVCPSSGSTKREFELVCGAEHDRAS